MKKRSKAAVSYNMSRIKAKNTGIERIISSEMRKAGLKGFRRNVKNIIGKPDFVSKEHKLAVFCDSAFWHGYRWGKKFKDSFRVRKKFWFNKIESNRNRDRLVNRTLKKGGWKVLRFWDFQIIRDPDGCVELIQNTLNGNGRKND